MFKALTFVLAVTGPATAQQKNVVLYGMNQQLPAQTAEQERCEFYDLKDSKGKTRETVRCYCYGASSDKDILTVRKGA
jgi:hypothetical protein